MGHAQAHAIAGTRQAPRCATTRRASLQGVGTTPALVDSRLVPGTTSLLPLAEERPGCRPAVLRRSGLSLREPEVVALIAEALTSPIAARLGSSPRTIQTYLERADRELGVGIRAAGRSAGNQGAHAKSCRRHHLVPGAGRPIEEQVALWSVVELVHH